MKRLAQSLVLASFALSCGERAVAQFATPGAGPTAQVAPSHAQVSLSAIYAPGDSQPIRSGLSWRVFSAKADTNGAYALVAESKDATPAFLLDDGDYIVHVGCGLAGAARQISVNGFPVSERVTLNAGGLKISGVLGEAAIPPTKLNIQVYLPDHNDPEAKLILPNLKANDVECVPEGAYHIVSKLMDTTLSAVNATNSVIYADLRVQAGKMTAGVLRHRAATMTLKLVNMSGGEALANTSFSILTPGGDVIRELIGAFPSLVLAEGEYVAIARHENKTYQATFKVLSSQDRDVEVLAQQPAQ
jgi:hypothetical protein